MHLLLKSELRIKVRRRKQARETLAENAQRNAQTVTVVSPHRN
jgi:hypothetical protein